MVGRKHGLVFEVLFEEQVGCKIISGGCGVWSIFLWKLGFLTDFVAGSVYKLLSTSVVYHLLGAQGYGLSALKGVCANILPGYGDAVIFLKRYKCLIFDNLNTYETYFEAKKTRKGNKLKVISHQSSQDEMSKKKNFYHSITIDSNRFKGF
jgi:hypothetical protein